MPRKRRGKPRLHHWNDLFAAGRFELRRGRDYTCSLDSIVQQVRNAASARELNILVDPSDDGQSVGVVVVQAANGVAP